MEITLNRRQIKLIKDVLGPVALDQNDDAYEISRSIMNVIKRTEMELKRERAIITENDRLVGGSGGRRVLTNCYGTFVI